MIKYLENWIMKYSIYHLKIQAKYILEIQRFKKNLHVDNSQHAPR